MPGNVSHVRPEVARAETKWSLIRDCLDGEQAVKERKSLYLPVPDAETGGTVNDARYKSYITRAVFYGVTGRTLEGLVGQVFGRDSVIEFTGELEGLVDDSEGDGVGIEQQAKRGLEYVLGYGRAGLLADYPQTGGAVTRQDVEDGNIQPVLRLYRPEHIINWRTKRVGKKTILSLVVLREVQDEEDDGFEVKTEDVYRVLRLDDTTGNYTVDVYKAAASVASNTPTSATTRAGTPPPVNGVGSNESGGFQKVGDTVTPTDASGQPWKEIPFTFIGAENNDHQIDESPLYDLAVLNIAHYRNSADYEEAIFIAGQPTLWASGLTEEWVKNVLDGVAFLGSRKALPLPVNGQAGLLQVTANIMPIEGMKHKETQMRAIGAKLVEERGVRRTATEASQDEASETSILSSATKNLNAAYNKALEWAARFTSNGEFEFKINSDFDLSDLDPNERQQLIAEWQSEAITWTEMRTALKRSRIAFQDDEEARSEIEHHPPMTAMDTMTINQGNEGGEGDEDDENGGS